jgi:hypothetical protein
MRTTYVYMAHAYYTLYTPDRHPVSYRVTASSWVSSARRPDKQAALIW